jgi:hypothetical protein
MPTGLSVIPSRTAEGVVKAALGRPKIGPGSNWNVIAGTETEVSVVVYLLLTVAIFALLGTVLKLVERL